MTLDDLMAADKNTKDDLSQMIYKKLKELYVDQYGAKGKLDTNQPITN